jgi:hypothetical protein
VPRVSLAVPLLGVVLVLVFGFGLVVLMRV